MLNNAMLLVHHLVCLVLDFDPWLKKVVPVVRYYDLNGRCLFLI